MNKVGAEAPDRVKASLESEGLAFFRFSQDIHRIFAKSPYLINILGHKKSMHLTPDLRGRLPDM